MENQRRVSLVGLEEFLHTALLYHATNTRNINIVAVLNNTWSSLQKNNEVTSVQIVIMST